jgi:hypothetical protein
MTAERPLVGAGTLSLRENTTTAIHARANKLTSENPIPAISSGKNFLFEPCARLSFSAPDTSSGAFLFMSISKTIVLQLILWMTRAQ